MSKEFDKTPSFFNDEETFEKYLANTSYYTGLQNCVKKIIGFINPAFIAELGCATGATSIKLAENFPSSHITGVDIREDVIKIAEEQKTKKNIVNLDFIACDMTECDNIISQNDFILMLYSFHHIVDPISKKIEFLNNTYKNMKAGSYLCIAETFIPDYADGNEDEKAILDLWKRRSNEGNISTFWNSLSGIGSKDLQLSEAIAAYCEKNEYLAGELVAKRDEEYLVQPKWLRNHASQSGFEIVLEKPINMFEDRIILLKR